MARATPKELDLDEVGDLYDAENQWTKALPKMAKQTSPMSYHPESDTTWNTQNHARRIERIFDALSETATSKKCKGMQRVISERNAALKDGWEDPVRDADHGCRAARRPLRNRDVRHGSRVRQDPRRKRSRFAHLTELWTKGRRQTTGLRATGEPGGEGGSRHQAKSAGR
jgi:Domain of unknown function (DUF892)